MAAECFKYCIAAQIKPEVAVNELYASLYNSDFIYAFLSGF